MKARGLFFLLLLSVSPAQAQNAGPAAPPAMTEKGGPKLGDLLKLPAYASAWRVMLAGQEPPDWVKKYGQTLDGPPTPSIPVQLLGETYTLGFTCKPNDCENNQLYVLFAPEARDAWGMLTTSTSGPVWLGRPEQPIQDGITGALGR